MTVATAEPIIGQNYSIPNTGGITTAFNNIGTGGGQVIAADPQRKIITFHNPNYVSNIILMIYQMLDVNGNALAPTFASPGGGWVIVPAAYLSFTGDCQGAWGAVSQSAANNGLTIISSRSVG